MPRLRRADCSGPGIRRRRYGKGFAYFDSDGDRIDDPEVLTRITGLAIPPAWADVWICPYPHGHLQATGTDAAGRKQYRYHDAWRERRDTEKFETMARFARALPRLRERVEADLGDCDRLDRRCVLALAVRLLERGFFRIGSEEYAADNESYGLATLRKDHVRVEAGGVMIFDYPAKSGQQRRQGIQDERAAELVATLKRRRGGNPELLAYKERGRWRDVRSEEINLYLKAATGSDFSAKDFRTWNATMLAAIALGVSGEVAREPDRAQARDQPRDRRGRALPRQHAGRLPRLLHRPARVRRLPGGAHDPARARAGGGAAGAGRARAAAAGARARGARSAQRARGVAGRGAGRGVARSPPPRRASIRRSDGPAVTPCTTIDSSTAATHVHTTASCSAAPSAPEVTITAA